MCHELQEMALVLWKCTSIVGAKLSIFPDNKGNFNPFLPTFPGGILWLGRHFLAPFLSRIQELLTFCHLHKHAKS